MACFSGSASLIINHRHKYGNVKHQSREKHSWIRYLMRGRGNGQAIPAQHEPILAQLIGPWSNISKMLTPLVVTFICLCFPSVRWGSSIKKRGLSSRQECRIQGNRCIASEKGFYGLRPSYPYKRFERQDTWISHVLGAEAHLGCQGASSCWWVKTAKLDPRWSCHLTYS